MRHDLDTAFRQDGDVTTAAPARPLPLAKTRARVVGNERKWKTAIPDEFVVLPSAGGDHGREAGGPRIDLNNGPVVVCDASPTRKRSKGS